MCVSVCLLWLQRACRWWRHWSPGRPGCRGWTVYTAEEVSSLANRLKETINFLTSEMMNYKIHSLVLVLLLSHCFFVFLFTLITCSLTKLCLITCRVPSKNTSPTCVHDRRPGPDIHSRRGFFGPQQFSDDLRGHHAHRPAHLHDSARTDHS